MTAAGLAGCGASRQQRKSATTTSEPKTGGTVRLSDTTDPLKLDPIAKDVHAMETVTGGLYGMLLRYKTGQEAGYTSTTLMPYVADSWETPDPQTFIFHLHHGVKYQNVAPVNGRELKAADVKYNLTRYQSKQATASYIMELVARIDTPDDYTVKVATTIAFAPFLTYMGDYEILLVPPEIVEAGQADKVFIGVGPFMYDSHQEGVAWRMKKNPDFFLKDAAGRQLPYLDGYQVDILPDDALRLAAFTTKKLEIGNAIIGGGPQLQTLKKQSPDAVIAPILDPGGDVFYVRWGQRPLDDVRVRQAMRIGLDPQAMITTLADGNGAYNISGEGAAWTDWTLPSDEIRAFYPHDPAKAKQLLRDAGYTTPPNLEVIVDSGMGVHGRQFAELFQAQMQEAGFDIKLTPIDSAAGLDRKRKGQFQLYGFRKSMRPDPDGNLYAVYHTGQSLNYSQVADPALDILLEKQRVQTDLTQRKQSIQEILRYLNQDVVGALQPFVGNQYFFWSPDVKGYYPHVEWGHGLKLLNTWLDR